MNEDKIKMDLSVGMNLGSKGSSPPSQGFNFIIYIYIKNIL